MQAGFDTHTLFEAGSAIATVAIFVVGLLIKNAISESKSTLLQNQADVKEELTKHNADVRKDLEVHIGKDEMQFESIKGILERIETKVG